MAAENNSGENSATSEMNFDWENPLSEAPDSQEPEEKAPPAEVPATPAAQAQEESLANLSLLLDIPLEITAELGRTRMIIQDLLQLGQGSVIELNKLAGEPLEILVNKKLIARGEVVVVNEKFGIRLTDIISPMERIKQLA
jgi:flagellar motor switch protein FliN/FliY